MASFFGWRLRDNLICKTDRSVMWGFKIYSADCILLITHSVRFWNFSAEFFSRNYIKMFIVKSTDSTNFSLLLTEHYTTYFWHPCNHRRMPGIKPTTFSLTQTPNFSHPILEKNRIVRPEFKFGTWVSVWAPSRLRWTCAAAAAAAEDPIGRRAERPDPPRDLHTGPQHLVGDKRDDEAHGAERSPGQAGQTSTRLPVSAPW